MTCISFWKSKKNYNPITMFASDTSKKKTIEEKKKINERKKTLRNENKK